MGAQPDRAASIFDAAVEFGTTAERAAYLDAACGQDRQLRAEVDGLLEHDHAAGSFLNLSARPNPQATVDEPAVTERPGTVIGPYKLLEQIGEGGFGVVFMAEQTQPVRRKVALKVLKPGMDTRQVVARFEAERQALALMDHPHIAHVFDGGQTASGRPYFVMELVRGVPITDFCDQSHLPVRERLELFLNVCQAVQHAHHKGIIHRDLKPSNVLLTLHDDKAVVKVIDFGIAKATGQQLTDKTLFTNFAQMIGTPLYMSPEQAQMSGLDVDTRSDVYSLGVLLYELLTGTTPFDKERLRTVGYDEIRRIIREEEAPRPSARISTLGQAAATVSMQRQSDPKRLSQLFRGELDWIVMKCLEKDRNRRYETASALAGEAQRYLHDEPVLACPPSAWYRFRKFARRNKGTLTTVAMGSVALALSTVILAISNVLITRERDEKDNALREKDTALIQAKANEEAADNQRKRAEENVKLAITVLDQIIVQEAVERLATNKKDEEGLLPTDPRAERQLRELIQKGMRFYEQLVQRNGTDPSAQLEAAKAYRSLAWLEMNLGHRDKGAACFQRAINLLEPLAARFPDVIDYELELANTYQWQSWPYRETGRLDEAEKYVRRAVLLYESLGDKFPSEVPRCRAQIAHCYKDLGMILSPIAGRAEEAERAYRKALAVVPEVPAASAPADDFCWYCFHEADTRRHLGNLLSQAGRTTEAIQVWKESLPFWDKLVAARDDPGHRRMLAEGLDVLGDLLAKADRLQEAEEYYRKAFPVWKRLAGDLNLPRDGLRQATNRERLGRLFEASGQVAQAERVYQQAVAVWEKLAVDYPAALEYRSRRDACRQKLQALVKPKE